MKRIKRIQALIKRLSDAFAARPARVSFALGLLFVVVYYFDGRLPFWILGGLLLVLALAPTRLRKVSVTGFSVEFQQQVASEIVVRARRPLAVDGTDQDSAVSEASVRAAARALAEAASPKVFARELDDFLDMKWRDAPRIESSPRVPVPPAEAEYRARFFGESAFLHLARGQAGQLAVGYENVGTKAWVVGTESQADLVIPPGSPDNSVFAAGWLSRERYASQGTTYVGPGQIGYFVYNVRVPDDAPLGVHRFRFRPENRVGVLVDDGGYQDVQVVG